MLHGKQLSSPVRLAGLLEAAVYTALVQKVDWNSLTILSRTPCLVRSWLLFTILL